jgi:hypothetical protein
MLQYNSHSDFFGGRKLHLLYISVSSRPFILPRRATNPLLCDRFRPPFFSIVFSVSLSNICDDSESYITETVRLSQRGSRGCRRRLKLKVLGKIFGETSPLDFQNFTCAQVTKNNIPFILRKPAPALLCLSLWACIIFVLLILL